MKKRLTFILLGLLLMVGGVSAQTALTIDGGFNWGANNNGSWGRDGDGNPSGTPLTSGTIEFHDNVGSYCNNIGVSCVGGANWAETFNAGDTHIFTVTLEENTPGGIDLFIAALSEEIDKNSKYGDKALVENKYGTINTSNVSPTNKTFTLTLTSNYRAVYLYKKGNSQWENVKIASITREVISASSVKKPSITPASRTYDGELSVTITPGEDNDRVVYSVSGSNEDASHSGVSITTATTINLTGNNTITVTAKGYKGTDESTEVTNTYTFEIPNGKTSLTIDPPYTFDDWNDNLEFNSSNFAQMGLGDYVVLGVSNITSDNTVLGFRQDWNESPFVEWTTVSSGNGAKGLLNLNDTQWWLKVSNNNNEDLLDAFKSHTIRIQGGMIPKEIAGTNDDVNSSVTLNTFDIYKSKAISELVDNTIDSKINNVVVELTRSLVADTWNTVCLPFSLTSEQATQLFGSGYKLASFTGVSGETMLFSTASSFEAGVPYLVKPGSPLPASQPVILIDVDITAKTGGTVNHDGYQFIGTLTTKSFTSTEWSTTRLVGAGNKLLTPTSTNAMKALRAYFVLPSAGSAPILSIEGEETTSLSEEVRVNSEEFATAPWYDLSGRRVENPTKGIYIHHGKKVVVK